MHVLMLKPNVNPNFGKKERKKETMKKMAALSRVSSIATKTGMKFDRWLCTKSSSISNPLLHKLLQQPISRIKTTLDASDSIAVFSTSEFPWDDFLVSLKSSSPDKARLVLEWRLEKMLKANEKDRNYYSHLISLCGKIQNVPFAMRVFSSMEDNGIKPNSTVFNALIHACLSSGNVTTSISMYEIMDNSESYKPDSDTYNVFIRGFSKLGNYNAMQAWYSAKRVAGFSADLQTYESLISGCVKSRNFNAADRFYEELVSFGLMPSIFILENMIESLCKQRNFDKIKEFLKHILDGGWEINGQMVKMLMGLYVELGRVEEMEELLLNLMKCNQGFDVLSQLHHGIIRMYVMLDKLDDVEYAVGRMLKQGISFTCADDVEKVICLYFKREAYDRLELFLESIKGSYKPTRSNYNLLVAGYRRAGFSVKLDLLMNDMKLAGFL